MILQWFKEHLIRRVSKTRHNIVKLNWNKAELEKLLENRDTMTPEEFKREYQRLV